MLQGRIHHLKGLFICYNREPSWCYAVSANVSAWVGGWQFNSEKEFGFWMSLHTQGRKERPRKMALFLVYECFGGLKFNRFGVPGCWRDRSRCRGARWGWDGGTAVLVMLVTAFQLLCQSHSIYGNERFPEGCPNRRNPSGRRRISCAVHGRWKEEGATEIRNAHKILIVASNILWRGKNPFTAAWLLFKGTQKGYISDYALPPHCSESRASLRRPKPN